jgi:hypothetical protein
MHRCSIASRVHAALILVAAIMWLPASGAEPPATETIRIGIIAEESAIGGDGIVQGSRMAVDKIPGWSALAQGFLNGRRNCGSYYPATRRGRVTAAPSSSAITLEWIGRASSTKPSNDW